MRKVDTSVFAFACSLISFVQWLFSCRFFFCFVSILVDPGVPMSVGVLLILNYFFFFLLFGGGGGTVESYCLPQISVGVNLCNCVLIWWIHLSVCGAVFL